MLMCSLSVNAAITPEQIDKSAAGSLANGWRAYWEFRYDAAAKSVEALAKSRQSPNRWHAAHLQARAWLASGDRQRQRQAALLWTQMARAAGNDPFAVARVKIGKALMQIGRSRGKLAIDDLKRIADERLGSIITAEVLIDLALIQAGEGQVPDAMAQLETADAFLKLAESNGIPEPLAKVFQETVEHTRELIKTPGRLEYEKGVAMRVAGRTDLALELFNQVIAAHGGSEYAIRSELQVGHCLLDMNKADAAIETWKKFISAAPLGPWRGQAYLAVVDGYIEYKQDLVEAQRHVNMAMTAMPAAMKNEVAADSWKTATFDLRVRQGGLAMLQKLYINAAAAFAEAGKTEKLPKEKRQAMAELVAWAKDEQSLVPQEIDPTQASASLPLAMASVYCLAAELGDASDLVERILAGQCGRLSRVETSFAHFEQAKLLELTHHPDPAKNAYAKSYQVYREGSWHDSTLYRLARLTQQQIDQHFKDVLASFTESATPDPAKPIGPARLAAYAQIQREVMGYWTSLIESYPKSAYLEPALRHAGELHRNSDSATDAARAWSQYTQAFADSPWAGRVYADLIDVQLENLFDLDAATKTASAAVQWAKRSKKQMATLAVDVPEPDDKQLRTLRYGVFLRAGLTAYLDAKYRQSAAMFRMAKPLEPIKPHGPGSLTQARVGLDNVIEAARTSRKLTPDLVLEGDAKARVVMQLADIYLEVGRWKKVISLCDIVIGGKDFVPTAAQKSWAHNQRASAIYSIPDGKNALEDYAAAQKCCPTAPWAAEALFYSGTITNNFLQDHKEASKLFAAVVSTYPESDIADKAAYFVGVAYEWAKDWPAAKKAYQEFLKQYPQSKWVRLVQTRHLPNVEEKLSGR